VSHEIAFSMITKNTGFKAKVGGKAMLALPEGDYKSTRTGADHDDDIGVHTHSFSLQGKMSIRKFSILLGVLIHAT
jgi:hypothetical protein